MRLKFLFPFLFLSLFTQAQTEKSDSAWFSRKRILHYAGIQMNPLIQQFISFNSNASINNNPYLFSFSINNAQTGHGFAVGTGLNVTQSATNDGVASISVQNINVSVRIGYEKKFLQRQKFIPFVGVEFGMGGGDSKTTSTLNQSFNNSTTTIETSKFFFGPAVRSGLNYAITRHILIGTEFFFNMQIAWTTTKTNNAQIITSNSDVVPFNIGFQTPTALFLMFRY